MRFLPVVPGPLFVFKNDEFPNGWRSLVGYLNLGLEVECELKVLLFPGESERNLGTWLRMDFLVDSVLAVE